MDIETSPNIADVWGLWDQNVGLSQLRKASRIIGFGYKWRGGGKAKWVGEYDPSTGELSQHAPMIEALHHLYEQADVVVTYNGNRFDHKHINGEFAVAGMTPPSPVLSLDLFVTVKKQFKFPSNKLAYVAQRLIGDTKIRNGGHQLWRDCLDHDVDAKTRRDAWKLMGDYCKQDVDLLEPLHKRLEPWLPTTINLAVIGTDCDEAACPRCASTDIKRKGFSYTATRAYQRFRCGSCGGWFKSGKAVKVAAQA